MQLTIDGRQVEVPEGVSVREAARLAGIEIPGLCDHPDLEPYGGCRLCLVEIEGIRGYPSSCTTPAAEGMRVRTDTPPLAEMRRSILEIILSQHPSGCLLCDRAGRCDEVRGGMRKAPKATGCRYCPKDGRCELQRAAEQVGLDRIDHPRLSSESGVVRGPFFDRDPDLCILCGRCVRVCQAQGSGAISFLFRGFETRIGTAYDRPL
ncbi:MAG: 2Fe-2S iron-sulfur cluster-binding protein, partial [Methanothrix sp.]|nr:2Fe-2S iron-sulfur cluster-binding protein [Methanothrix sp.]